MQPYPSVSLIISTYNWPAALKLVLLSICRLRVMPDEIIVADDGSTSETRHLIDTMRSKFSVPLLHVWQADEGFRLSTIRNKAICQCHSDYIIQIDGDVILHPSFIEDHLRLAAESQFLIGSRVLLNANTTAQAQQNGNVSFNACSPGIKNRINAIRLPILSKLFLAPTTNPGRMIDQVRGCNMSFWKKDFHIANGYNEEIVGWGREDSELCIRFIHNGLVKRRIKFGAIQYHQHHVSESRNRISANDTIMLTALKEVRMRCVKGVDQHCVYKK